MSYAIRVNRADAGPIACVRRQVSSADLSRVVPECCGLVWAAVKAQGAHGGRHVALYWDDAVRLEVGVELHGPFTDVAPVVRSATPAGLVATTTHLGPYGGLKAAHDAMHRWSHDSGRRLAGPRWELYGHWQPQWNVEPALIRTDVYYLLEH
jgi:effector-binding domain-containing protein